MTEFEKRFRRFIAGCPDCKILDDGVSNPPGGIADFLISGNCVVAELKCLEANKSEPLQRLATELIETRQLPIYGEIPFDKIIEDQPDRSSLKRKAILTIAGRLQDDFKDANNQIKNTKSRLGLKDSHGLLILANTSNQPLDPQLAHDFLSFVFNKRKEKGGPPICSSIDCVLYLPQLHTLGRLPDGAGLQPAIPLFRDQRVEYEVFRTYLVNTLLKNWAAFNGQRYFVTDQPFPETKDFSNRPLRSLERKSEQTKPGWFIETHFTLPRSCRECEATLDFEPTGHKQLMQHREPQPGCFVVYVFCPTCDEVAEVYAGDLAVDRKGNVVNVYPWSGTPTDLTATNWRSFIRRWQ
jgi:hypothetical protein